jgi:N-acetylmuramoyl-L-alanine amidase
LLGLWCSSQALAGAQLLDAALQAGRDSATLTLALSAPVKQHVFAVIAPDRLVIDLPATRAAKGLRLPAATGVVKAVRSGVRPDGGLRVVVELRSTLKYSIMPTWPAPLAGAASYQLRVALGAAPRRAATLLVDPADTYEAAPAVQAAHAPISSDRDIVVAVDAGHGGEDPGASGHGGTHEKDVVLAIARALAARINQEPGMRAVLTRDADRFIPLRERMARAARADLFVSIHADAVRDRTIEGASVYVLSDRGASSEAARMLAEGENAADLKGGVSLSDENQGIAPLLLDLSQSASLGTSVEAAERVLEALDGVGAVRKKEVQRAAFVVLKSPDVPSMLVETAYISNPIEERKLCTGAYQQQLAGAIYAGVAGYFRQHPPDGTLFARQRRDAAGGPINVARSSP